MSLNVEARPPGAPASMPPLNGVGLVAVVMAVVSIVVSILGVWRAMGAGLNDDWPLGYAILFALVSCVVGLALSVFAAYVARLADQPRAGGMIRRSRSINICAWVVFALFIGFATMMKR